MDFLNDYINVNSILDNQNIKNFDWYYIHLFLRKYKDNISNSNFIILILTKSINIYLYQLKNSGHEIDIYNSCKIFINWLGFPSYDTYQLLDFMILNCMREIYGSRL